MDKNAARYPNTPKLNENNQNKTQNIDASQNDDLDINQDQQSNNNISSTLLNDDVKRSGLNEVAKNADKNAKNTHKDGDKKTLPRKTCAKDWLILILLILMPILFWLFYIWFSSNFFPGNIYINVMFCIMSLLINLFIVWIIFEVYGVFGLIIYLVVGVCSPILILLVDVYSGRNFSKCGQY